MARTILGLVNWTDGKVYFGDPPCDTRIACIAEDVEGCIEWTGEHAGQVKVIISQADLAACNDTYYGCVDWTTGKFQITMPDTCCTGPGCDEPTLPTWDSGLTYSVGHRVTYQEHNWISLQDNNINHTPISGSWWWPASDACPCSYSAQDSPCWDAGKTPAYLVATVSGIRQCSDDNLWAGNGVWCLSGPTAFSGYEHVWQGVAANAIIYYLQNEFNEAIVMTELIICTAAFSPQFFQDEAQENPCDKEQYFNNHDIGDCSEGVRIGYGGSIILCNPCSGGW